MKIQKKHIEIKNSAYNNQSSRTIERDIPILTSDEAKPKRKTNIEDDNRGQYQLSGYLIAGTMFLLILIFIYILHSINPIF